MPRDSEYVYDYAKQARMINKTINEVFEQIKREDERKVKIFLKNPVTQQISELTAPVELMTLEIY
jgi:hypothetical protein